MADKHFMVTQLKATLRRLELPQAGDKATLLKRLHAHDPSGAWKDIARKIAMEEYEKEQQTDNEDYEDTATGQSDPFRNLVTGLSRPGAYETRKRDHATAIRRITTGKKQNGGKRAGGHGGKQWRCYHAAPLDYGTGRIT